MGISRRSLLTGVLSFAGARISSNSACGDPPMCVKDWLLHPDQLPIDIPPNYIGLHSSHGIGLAVPTPTYPYDAIRSHDVDNGHDRSATQWADIEISAGQYNWNWVDKWIAAHADRTKIWVLFGTPKFYQKFPNEPFPYPYLSGGGSPPKDPKTAAAFIAALLQRHPGEIHFVELWNEPNLGPGSDPLTDRWTPAVAKAESEPGWFTGTACDLAEMARVIRSVLPDGVKLMAGAWTNQAVSSTSENSLLRFARAPDGAGGFGRDHVQALSVHAYTTNYKPNDNIRTLRLYEKRFAQAGFSKTLPRYVTETGAEGDGHWTADAPKMSEKVMSIKRWGMIPAALGYRGVYYYSHSTMRQLGDPSHNPELSDAIATVRNGLRGKTLKVAAVLGDETIWMSFTDGSEMRA
jgi:hypothetical protein